MKAILIGGPRSGQVHEIADGLVTLKFYRPEAPLTKWQDISDPSTVVTISDDRYIRKHLFDDMPGHLPNHTVHAVYIWEHATHIGPIELLLGEFTRVAKDLDTAKGFLAAKG